MVDGYWILCKPVILYRTVAYTMNASQISFAGTKKVPSFSLASAEKKKKKKPPVQHSIHTGIISSPRTRCQPILYRSHATEDLQSERVGVTHLDLVPGTRYAQKCIGVSLALLLGGLCIQDNAVAGTDAAATFENTCAGCHAGGGNIVKRDATLALSDLQKYGLDGPDALYSIIYNGNGSMPGYGAECAPKGKCTFGKRLSDSEISELATYVLDKAKSGW